MRASRGLKWENKMYKPKRSIMYDISNNLSPSKISNIFTYQANVQSYETRSSSRGDYFVESSRLDIQKKASNQNRLNLKVKFKTSSSRESQNTMIIMICLI